MKSAGPHKKTGPAEAAAEPRRFQDSFGSNPLAPEDVDELDLCHLWWRQLRLGHRVTVEKVVILIEGGWRG